MYGKPDHFYGADVRKTEKVPRYSFKAGKNQKLKSTYSSITSSTTTTCGLYLNNCEVP